MSLSKLSHSPKNMTKLPKLLLNMIVRDEEHIVIETLETVLPYIGYYVICDTGSKDKTVKKIIDYFNKHNIPGIILHHEWKNFCHNRTLALEACTGLSEYIWVIDADDIVVGTINFPSIMTSDSYSLIYGDGFTYHRMQIFKNDPAFGWHYRCPVHEYPCSKLNNTSNQVITGSYYIDSRRLGSRSKNPNKYLDDAISLKNYLKDAGDDYARCVFYMGNSYHDHAQMTGSIDEMLLAIDAYKERITLGNWYEEIFYSYYKLGQSYQYLNKKDSKTTPWSTVKDAYLNAYNYCKNRIEPIHEIVKVYNERKNYKEAYKYSKMVLGKPFPTEVTLFIYKSVYDYEMTIEFIKASYGFNKIAEAYFAAKKLLRSNNYGTNRNYLLDIIKKCTGNLNKTNNNTTTNNCLIYLDYNILTKNLDKFIKTLLLSYNVYIYSPNVNYSISKYGFRINLIKDFANIKNVKYSQIFLYDNLNLSGKTFNHDNHNIHVTLLLTDSYVKMYSPDGIRINLLMIKDELKGINKIVCIDKTVRDQVISRYGSKNIDYITCYEDNEAILFDKTNFMKYEPDTDKTGQFTFNIDNVTSYELNISNQQPEYLLMINNMIKYFNMLPSLNYYKYTYYKETKDWKNAELAITSLKCNNIIKSAYTADLYYNKGQIKEAYDLCNKLLFTNDMPDSYVYPNSTFIENIMELCYDHMKSQTLLLPKVLPSLSSSNNNSSNSKILFTMTTCKRLKLFKKTINSFINCCTDHNLITDWFIIDDNSEQQDLEFMKTTYPFIKIISKDQTQKGHYKSMNIIYDLATNNNNNNNKDNGYKYWLHLEDDFHFINKRNYISDSIKILESEENNKVGQVLFNRNYAEIEHYKQTIYGGKLKSSNNIKYIEHEHYDKNLEPELYKKFYETVKGNNCMYWPHYSFRPSVVKVQVLKELGPFSNCTHFEMEYAKEYVNLGYKSVFFNSVNCIHIGKKTWEKGDNAYNLNSVEQFTNGSENSINIICNNYLNLEQKTLLRQCLDQVNNNYDQKYNIKYIKDKTVNNVKRYYKNDFNYHHKLIQYNELVLETFADAVVNNRNTLTILFDPLITDTSSFINVMNDNANDGIIFLDNSDNSNVSIDNHYNIIIRGSENIINAYNILMDSNIKVSGSMLDILSVLNHESLHCISSISDLFKMKDEYNLEGYNFYSMLDYYGSDIGYYGSDIQELKRICDGNDTAVCFNTNGWIKHTVGPVNEFCMLYGLTNAKCGLYIKKSIDNCNEVARIDNGDSVSVSVSVSDDSVSDDSVSDIDSDIDIDIDIDSNSNDF